MAKEQNVTGTLEGVMPVTESEMTLRQKSAFAVQHLMAAARFSRLCGKVENRHLGQPLGSFFDKQIAYVSGTIMLSVASIESNVNEYLTTPEIIFSEYLPHVRNEFCELVSELAILKKYQRILAFNGLPIFEKGVRPYQDVNILISLRNELVHFHPEWHDSQERHRKLGAKLMHRFELSPFIAENSGVIFPQRFVSHGCTKWAIEYSLRFMEQFEETMGLPRKFDNFKDKLVP